MRSEPLVSIAINNYNYGRFLREAIDSALAQTYPRTEVIVVDDGSTDGSREIIEAYGEQITPVLKENRGQASAINAGFAASSGEIVIFLDADDCLVPEAVEKLLRVWRPELAKVQYLLEVIDGDGRRQGELRPTNSSMPSGDLRDLILSRGTYLSSPTSGNAIARRTLDELLPMPEKEWRISADGYLANLVPFFGEVLSLHETLGFYRVHNSNNWTMQEINLRRIRDFLAHDIQKQELISEFGKRMGLKVDKEMALSIPAHVKFRLASLRMDPESHPYPEDSRWSLTFRGISGCWRSSEFALRKRIFYSVWFTLVAFSPNPAFRSLIAVGLVPIRRPRFMRLMDVRKQSESAA